MSEHDTHPRTCVCGRHVLGSSALCSACTEELRGHLLALPELVGELEVTLARQAHVAAPNPSTGASLGARDGQPLPFDVAASQVLDGLLAFAREWLAELDPAGAQLDHLLPRFAGNVPRAALYALVRAERAAVGHSGTPELLRQARRARKLAQRTIDHPVHLVWLGPCRAQFLDEFDHVVGECTGVVRAPAGDAVGVCRTCGAEHDALARNRWLLDSARELLLNISQLGRQLAAYGVGGTERGVVRAVQRLVAEQRLQAAGSDPRGAATYRVGDVLAALASRRTYRRTTVQTERNSA